MLGVSLRQRGATTDWQRAVALRYLRYAKASLVKIASVPCSGPGTATYAVLSSNSQRSAMTHDRQRGLRAVQT